MLVLKSSTAKSVPPAACSSRDLLSHGQGTSAGQLDMHRFLATTIRVWELLKRDPVILLYLDVAQVGKELRCSRPDPGLAHCRP